MKNIFKLSLLTLFCITILNSKTVFAETITVSFAGDCTLGTFTGQGMGNRFDEVYKEQTPDYFLKNVQAAFANDDLTIVNLEGPLTDRKTVVQKKFPIRGEREYVNILTSGSVEMCALANNHMLDCGDKGLKETKETLAQNKIAYAYCDDIGYFTKNGITFALLSFNGFSDTKNLRDQIQKDITEAKKKADIVAVMYHWGIEREYKFNASQQNLAHFTIDSGADLVIGGHPHVLQGVETYKGCSIAYSLGNFSFGANKNPKDKDAYIFQQTFEVKNKKIVNRKTNIIPCKISSVDTKNNYQPTIQTGTEATRIMEKIQKYSK